MARRIDSGDYSKDVVSNLEMQAAAEQAAREILPNPSDPHTSLVAVEPSTGAVRALVGGRDLGGSSTITRLRAWGSTWTLFQPAIHRFSPGRMKRT